MIIIENHEAVEDSAKEIVGAASASKTSILEEVAALSQALGFVLEHARNRRIEAGISLEELDELVDRYKRRGALIEQAIAAHEGRTYGN